MVEFLKTYMLYKKYHRKFVGRFKIGATFKLCNYHSKITKPCYITGYSTIEIEENNFMWIVVFSSGKINKRLHAV